MGASAETGLLLGLLLQVLRRCVTPETLLVYNGGVGAKVRWES